MYTDFITIHIDVQEIFKKSTNFWITPRILSKTQVTRLQILIIIPIAFRDNIKYHFGALGVYTCILINSREINQP